MFNTGRPVTGEEFYDRTAMLGQVRKMLDNRQNVMIKAPRRYGKTSLIKQLLSDGGGPSLYLDLRRVPRLDMIAERIVDFAYDREGVSGFFKRLRESALGLLRESRQQVTVNLEFLEYTIEFFENAVDPCEMFVKALDVAETVGVARGEHYVIVMDEFQDIGRYNCDGSEILEALRGAMQHHQALTYVFLGSVEHLMTKIFENRKSPFYQFARKFQLGPFDLDELQRDLTEAFGSRQIVFRDEAALRALLERLEGHPSNTMMVMQNIFYKALDLDLKLVENDLLDAAYEEALEESGELLDQYISEIKGRKHNYDVLYRLIRNEPQVLTGARLNQVFSSLMETGHIYRAGRGKYRVYDGFLVEYIKRV